MILTTLKQGSTGELVAAWQQFLVSRDIDVGVDGKFGAKTVTATKQFQQSQGLGVDGKVGPKTFAKAIELGFALVDEDETDDEGGEEDDGAHGGPLGADPDDDDPGSVKPDPAFVPSIADRREFGAQRLLPEKIRGARPASDVKGLVLHQMGFSRGIDLRRYDGVTAHYVIMADGQIGWLHPHEVALHASDKGFNPSTIAVEFAGNFPSIRGRWWKLEKHRANHLSPRQVTAGRFLVEHLKNTGVITQVFAHIQAGGTNRGNCPGPDIWSSVGQWAVEKLGLDDGGPGFIVPNRHGMGLPIPDKWRTWGR